jgi:hypothetical protein
MICTLSFHLTVRPALTYSHRHYIFVFAMGKLRIYLSSVPVLRNAIQIIHANSTTFFNAPDVPVAT